jgi:hypothetical protein
VAVVVPEPHLVDDFLIVCIPAPDHADNKCIGLHTTPSDCSAWQVRGAFFAYCGLPA